MKLVVNSRPITFKPDLKTEFWMKEKILIHDKDNSLEEPEAKKIIEYLYEEGFILDRRTPYEVVRAEGIEPPTSTV